MFNSPHTRLPRTLTNLALLFGLTIPLEQVQAQAAPTQQTAAKVDPFALLKVNPATSLLPLNALISVGQPPNAVPPLGFADDLGGLPNAAAVKFETPLEASLWIKPQEPVIFLTVNGKSAIVPFQVLIWHDAANFELGGVPLVATYCPLCNTATVFDRRVKVDAEASKKLSASTVLERNTLNTTFGTAGLIYNSNLVFFDSATHSLWSQLGERAVAGPLAGTPLEVLPSQVISFAAAVEAAPDAQVVSKNTGYPLKYGQNPFPGYDDVNTPPFALQGQKLDDRLLPKARVVSITLGGATRVYPFDLLKNRKVINDTLGGQPLVVFWIEGVVSAVDAPKLADSRDVGMAGAFNRKVQGRTLTFRNRAGTWQDLQTASTWTIAGQAVAGPLKGQRLATLAHLSDFWAVLAAFKPDATLYR